MSPIALNVGTLVAELVLNRKDFDRGVTESERRFGGLGSKLGGAAKGIGVAVATGLAVAGTAAASGAVALYGTGVAIDALGKKAATVFGPELGKAQQWAAQNAEAMGLTRSQAVGLAAGFSDLLIPMGFTRQQATQMSTDVVGLSGALSEWSGGQKTAAEVSDILAKAMLGERDGLKALGVSISDADVKARLAAKGQDKLTGAALEQAKALVTQQLIMEKSTDAQAAYAAGADNPIRKQAQLRARALELKEAFATALLPASNAVIGGLLQMSEGALPKVEAKLAAATVGVQGFVAGLQGKGSVDGFTGRLNYLGLGLRALVEAFRDGDVTSNGFVGKMERVGVAARSAWDQLAVVKAGVGEFAAGLMMSTAAAAAVGGSMDGLSGAGARVRLALASAKEAVMGMFPTNATGGIDFAATLDRVEAGARKLWPQVKEVGASLAGLGPVVTVTGAVFGFFADHIDTVVQYMPLLIAGFIAWKTAQALSLAVQITQLPITIALAASNLAYASAVYALLAAMGIERTSRIASIAAWAVHLVQIVAHNVALLALRAGIIITTGAMYAITAAQWLLNAALTANPIGLVIAAIALLVGGLILAYKNSETFRNIVDGAFRAVGAAATWLWDMAIKPAFAFISDAMGAVKRTTLTVVGEMVKAWFWFAEKILQAAEFGLSWTGKFGDKITTARAGMAAVVGAITGEIEKLKGKDIVLDVKANGSYTMSAARAANEHTGIANRRATGGAIHGWGTGTSDSIPALLSDDEHVWTAEEVQKAGGHSRMYALRAAVRSGALGAYATGGAVGVRAAANIGRIVPEQYDPTEKALLSGIATTVGSGIAAAQAAVASASAAPGGVAGRGNVDAELLRRFDAWNASMGGVLRIVSGYRSSAKQAELYAAYLNGTGNLAARPGSSNHEKSPARAIDYGPASWARTPSSYAYGLKAPVRSEPWHLERAFDDGGVARGSGMMPKFNPRPERVLSPRQTEAFERLVDVIDERAMGGSAVMGGVTYSGTVNVVDPEEFARRTVARQRDAAAVAGLSSIL